MKGVMSAIKKIYIQLKVAVILKNNKYVHIYECQTLKISYYFIPLDCQVKYLWRE